MDITNIIKKLQDIDKIKLIFFDNNQRDLFEMLPKPGIASTQSKIRHSRLTMETILASKNDLLRRKIKKNTNDYFNEDPLNKRMLEMIDPDVKDELQKINNVNQGSHEG